jgi:predicted dehydrogenase
MKDFLVIGTGSIGCRHIQCLKDLAVPNIYIVEPNEANRKRATSIYDIKESFNTTEEALQRQYDGAIVAVPNHLHAKVACQVIEKKIDLIIEKPIEITLENAAKIQKSVEANKVICLVAYVFRFDAAIQRVHEILQSGKMGKIYSADISTGQYLPDWRPGIDYRTVYSSIRDQGGGVCLDISHEFDYFRWLFGEHSKVYSIVQHASDLEMNVEDMAECLIACKNGTIGRVHLDYLSRAVRRQLYINGSKGTLYCDLITGEIKLFLAENNFWQLWNLGSERNIRYKNQLKHFFECVEARKQPLITVADAVKTLELTLEVRKSFKP